MPNLKWEYKSFSCATFGGENLEGLNSLGEEGWEIIAVTLSDSPGDRAGYKILLKREK